MSEEYILPSEFLALLGFWFGPPLLVAFVLQSRAFLKRGTLREHWARFVGALISTTLLSVLFAFVALAFLPKFLSFLGVQSVHFGQRSIMLLPLSFVVVAVVSLFVTWAALAGLMRRPN